MKEDERRLLRELARLQIQSYGGEAGFRDNVNAFASTHVGVRLGIPEKRAEYILRKWTDKGWWDYGVSARTGWLTKKGLAAAEEIKT